MGNLNIRRMTKRDFDLLLSRIDAWWGRPMQALLHPVYLYQLGDTTFVAERDGAVVGFVAGLISQTDPAEAYIHLVATDPAERKAGVARALYERLFAAAREKGCRTVKAITSPLNRSSIAFHERLGFRLAETGAVEIEGTKAVKDYSGPGQHRVVLIRSL